MYELVLVGQLEYELLAPIWEEGLSYFKLGVRWSSALSRDGAFFLYQFISRIFSLI